MMEGEGGEAVPKDTIEWGEQRSCPRRRFRQEGRRSHTKKHNTNIQRRQPSRSRGPNLRVVLYSTVGVDPGSIFGPPCSNLSMRMKKKIPPPFFLVIYLFIVLLLSFKLSVLLLTPAQFSMVLQALNQPKSLILLRLVDPFVNTTAYRLAWPVSNMK